jgi:hypothetical protein
MRSNGVLATCSRFTGRQKRALIEKAMSAPPAR